MSIRLPFPEIIPALVKSLEAGQSILYPTETVWGLGCDAHDANAVEKIYAIKERPSEKKFILLVDSVDMLKQYVQQIPQKAMRLIEHYEKPLTIIYDVAQNTGLATDVVNADNTVAIRVTRDPFCNAMVKAFGRAVVSTSANISGEAFPKSYIEISDLIKERVDKIANYKQLEVSDNAPSAIVKVIDGQDLIFIRK